MKKISFYLLLTVFLSYGNAHAKTEYRMREGEYSQRICDSSVLIDRKGTQYINFVIKASCKKDSCKELQGRAKKQDDGSYLVTKIDGISMKKYNTLRFTMKKFNVLEVEYVDEGKADKNLQSLCTKKGTYAGKYTYRGRKKDI